MIEDIQYLRENSVKENYLFLVDSKDRDKKVFPYSQEYKITFSSPFTHVFGIDVLDGSIPRTQYNVDSHNNRLRIKYRTSVNWTDIYVPIGDYNVSGFIFALNSELNANNFEILLENVTLPADRTTMFRLLSETPFEVDMYTSTINTTMGFDMYSSSTQNKYTLLIDLFRNSSNTFIKDYLLSLMATSENNDVKYNLNDSIWENYVGNAEYIKSAEFDMYQNYWFGSYVSNEKSTKISFQSEIFLGDTIDLQTGQKIIQKFKVINDGIFQDLKINVQNATTFLFEIYEGSPSGTPIYDATYVLESQNNSTKEVSLYTMFDYYAVLSLFKNEATFVSVQLEGNENSEYKATLQNSDNSNLSLNLALCFSIETFKYYNIVQAPGMYSLIADRYVMLKCKEIEDHIFRNRAYEKFSFGLAKFNLAVLGYDDSRFDFNKVPTREFHPIGKLTSLTFRFERPDGTLYDFKGINHTLTLVVKYYVPTQMKPLSEYSLNPEYDPDVFKYIQNVKYKSDDDESDEEIDN